MMRALLSRLSASLGLALIGLVAATAAHSAPGSVTYTYDDVGRLRNANYGCASTSYVLDSTGNRTSVQATAGGSSLQFAAATYSVSEANASVTISVARGCGTSGAVSVGYTLGGTATQTTDYTVSGTLSWAAGDGAPKSLTLTSVDNSVYAANKTVVLTLNAPTGGATIGLQNATTVTIVENDLPASPGAVQFTASTLSVSEGAASAQLTITRAGANPPVAAASVVCTPSNGTASSGSDYTAGAQTISWAANDVANKTCSIPLLNDTTFEGTETLTATLSSPTGGMTLGSPLTSTVSITDNDAVSFSIAPVSVNEGTGTVTLTVTKTGATVFTHEVNYATASGTAQSGVDFLALSGTLSFAPADTTKTVTVPIGNDPVYEVSEAFAVNLSAPTNGATLGTTSATVTIEDNDPAPSFAIGNVSVNESAGTVTLTVTMSGNTSQPHSVSYATANGTAVTGSDYTATSGTLAFASSDTSKTFTVAIANDTIYESSETFTATLSGATNGATIGTATATVTVNDNDTAPSFAIGNVSVNEGAGTATFTVTKTGSTALSHAVNYATANGTAVAGSDYTAASGTLTFASAETSKTFTVSITDDTVFESSETFTATLSAPTNGATLGTASATGTITENDAAVSFSINSMSATETSGSFNLTVTKTGSTSLTHDVSYATAAGTATIDFLPVSGTLSFAPGETTKVIGIYVGNDTIYEGTEAFTVNLSAPTNGAVLGTATGTITIADDDLPPTFHMSAVSVNENAGVATINIIKSGQTAFTHAVNYATANGTASAGSDYTATSGTLTFASTDSVLTVTVPITDDTAYEGNETLSLNLSGPTNGATIVTTTVTVTITENDPPPPDASFSINSVAVNETAGTATLTVTKSGPTTLTHNVNYASATGSATSGSDYTAVSGTLALGSAETSKTIVVSINNDSVYEGSESFSVNLSAPTNGAVIGTATGTVTISPDNDAAPILTFSTATVNESAAGITVTVTKGGDSDLTHSVNYATNGGTATSGVDFTPVSGTLTFAPGDYSKSVFIAIANDNLYEGTEGFAFVLSGATNGALPIQGPPGGAIYIEDDDLPPVQGSLQFSGSTSVFVSESVGSVTLTLSRTGASGAYGAASVVCATFDSTVPGGSTATAGVDYVPVSQTITWAAGDSSPKSCTVPIIDDTNFELYCSGIPMDPENPYMCGRTEYVYVVLSSASGATLGNPAYAMITIDDVPDSPVP